MRAHRETRASIYMRTYTHREEDTFGLACLLNVQFVCKLRFTQLRSLLDLMIFEIFGDEQDESIGNESKLISVKNESEKIVLRSLRSIGPQRNGKYLK